MDTDRRISFTVGLGGWTHVGWSSGTAYVRFARNPDRKTWRIAEIRLLEPTSENLRSLPLNRIEHAANAHGVVVIGLAAGHTQKAPADIAAMFESAPGPVPLDRLRLKRPKGRRLDTDFYKRVAIAYKGALAEGLNPRQTLAKDSGAAPDTVARWVQEARRRDFLPATEPGKVRA